MSVEKRPRKPHVIRVLAVDDHEIVRKGLKAVLDLVADIELVGEAENGRLALGLARKLKPDVILMDLMMPEMDGIACIKEIKAEFPGARILVLTNFAGEEMIFPAIKAGAAGYHLKDSTPEALVNAIHQVFRGESALHPLIARKVLDELHAGPERKLSEDPLTHRELQVLRLVAQGRENKAIADELVISEATVRTHVSNILSKLHLASRTQAALYALKEGLANLDGE